MGALLERSQPSPSVSRAKYAPRREPSVPRCEAPVDSSPAEERDALDAAFTSWLSQWMREHGVDAAFLATQIKTSPTIARLKITPPKAPKDRSVPFNFIDAKLLNPRLRAQFMFDVMAFFQFYDASH